MSGRRFVAMWLAASCLVAACVAPSLGEEPDGGSPARPVAETPADAQLWSIIADWQLQEFRIWKRWDPPYVVVEPQTRTAPPAPDALRADPGVQASTLAAYERVRDQRSVVDPANFHTRVPVVRDVPERTWEDLLAVHPEAKGVLGVSRVGFSEAGDQALVWFQAERLRSPTGPQRTFAVFDRTAAGWEMRSLTRMQRLPPTKWRSAPADDEG